MRAVLLVDCGNSTIKSQWVLSEQHSKPSAEVRWLESSVATCPNADASTDSLLHQWREAADLIGGLANVEVAISWLSVGPALVRGYVESAYQRLTGTPPPRAHRSQLIWQGGGLNQPDQLMTLHNGYAQPDQLGADRWASAVGALASGLITRDETRASTVLIISAGTATTMDLVRVEPMLSRGCEASFLGGWIWPGWGLMMQSLQSGTRDLQYEFDDSALHGLLTPPTNSRSAISAGIGLAQAAPIARLIDEIRPDTILLQGGAAEALRLTLEAMNMATKVVPAHNLSLRGLQALLD